ncbi:MAG TPA: cyclic nucleotide-binding domain-containing protein [bacterium]|nr:cyclic nucleotide-binding domain-containing protein [bacterium]
MAITPEQCKGMQILAGFEYEQVEKFIAGCSSEEFAAGKVLIRQDDPNDGKFYVVMSGAVEVLKNTRKGEELSARLARGEIFGEMGVFTDDKRMATIRATEATSCLVLTRDSYRQLRQSDPALALRFTENLLNVYFSRFRAVSSKAETASFWL